MSTFIPKSLSDDTSTNFVVSEDENKKHKKQNKEDHEKEHRLNWDAKQFATMLPSVTEEMGLIPLNIYATKRTNAKIKSINENSTDIQLMPPMDNTKRRHKMKKKPQPKENDNNYYDPSMNNLITVYGRGRNDNSQTQNARNNNDKSDNNNDKNNNNNCNSNNNNRNGSNNGSDNNDGDEKDNERYNDGEDEKDDYKNQQNKKEKDKEIELYLQFLSNMKCMNDNELKIQLGNFDDNILQKVRETWNELGNNMRRAELIKNGINTKTKIEIENNEQKSPMNIKRRKKKRKTKKYGNHNNYNLSKTKKMYRITKELTEEIIPNRISENINNPFDFMIKSLAINKNNASHFNQYRIFNFNLHDKNTNENLYFIGVSLDSTQNRGYSYSISDLLSENEMKSKYKIELHTLPTTIQLKDEFETKCVEEIIIKSINRLSKTNWHKIPIYNRTNNKRRMKLYLEKFEFTNYFQQFAQNKTDIELIPIVMFDENEKFYKEYIWIITIETNIKIGISFKYNKKQKSVFINGIHLDKTYLIQQHQLVSPSYIYNDLKHFTSTISHLHIGNPDDYINKINALQNRVDALKNSNDILKRYVRISPFNSNRSIITNMSCSSLDINSDHSLLSLSVNSDTDDTSNITTSLTPLHNNEVTNTNL